jgi:hypothetical protein
MIVARFSGVCGEVLPYDTRHRQSSFGYYSKVPVSLERRTNKFLGAHVNGGIIGLFLSMLAWNLKRSKLHGLNRITSLLRHTQ